MIRLLYHRHDGQVLLDLGPDQKVPTMPRPQFRHCSHHTASGQACKAWAVHGTDPPLCSAHAGRNVGAGARLDNENRRTHGFYAKAVTREELADLVAHEDSLSLTPEIACAPVAFRRLLHHLTTSGARTVARLLHVQNELGGGPSDELPAAISKALDELGEEWDVDL
jgi:hypothetical protein